MVIGKFPPYQGMLIVVAETVKYGAAPDCVTRWAPPAVELKSAHRVASFSCGEIVIVTEPGPVPTDGAKEIQFALPEVFELKFQLSVEAFGKICTLYIPPVAGTVAAVGETVPARAWPATETKKTISIAKVLLRHIFPKSGTIE